MQIKISRKSLILSVIQFMWLIILMPKMIQFFIYTALILVLLCKKRIRINNTALFFIGGAVVQILAIIRQCIIADPSMSRVAASINTTLIWFIGAIFYSMYAEENFTPDEVRRFKKYIRNNIVILFCLWVISLVARNDTYTILGHTWYLRRMDYLSSGVTKRFSALTETVLGPSHMLSLSMPVLLLDKKNRLIPLLISAGGFIAVYASHSRMGMLCCGAMLALFAHQYLADKLGTAKMRRLDTGLAICAVIGLIAVSGKISAKLYSLFNARAGSNGARFTIYRLSLQAAMTSPIIGCGIKNMIIMGDGYQFPYGSHSMYIGFLYKTGIVGTLLYLAGFFRSMKEIAVNLKGKSGIVTAMLIFLCYFGFLIFADLDASNWVVVLAFAVWGMLSNPSFREVCNE